MAPRPLVVTRQPSPGHHQPGHPERPERLQAVEQVLGQAGPVPELPFGAAAREDLERVHEPAYLERVEALCRRGGGALDADTYCTASSFQDARLACGAVVTAMDAVLAGEAWTAFALVRPPGHHALPGGGMGFCLVNHVAVAARRAQVVHALKRLAILDWDVHHGNGTQAVFYEDASVLYLSTHLYGAVPPLGMPFYPGTGALGETGRGAGAGATLNVPLPVGAGDRALGETWDRVLKPALRRFGPELLLVSAGYDAHWRDPLGRLRLSVAGYAWLTERVLEAARELCGGRLVLSLEGGYDLPALGGCVAAGLRVMAGEEAEDPLGPAPGADPEVADLLEAVRRQHDLG